MGGSCHFAGERLVISVKEFHRCVRDPSHTYRLDLIDDRGVVASEAIRCDEPSYFALDADPNAKFYRVEIFDTTRDLRIAIGNPIWND